MDAPPSAFTSPIREMTSYPGKLSQDGSPSLDEDSLKSPDVEKVGVQVGIEDDPDAEYGGHEARVRLERKLLRKIDLRMSVMVVIYILNYVSIPFDNRISMPLTCCIRSTGITQGMLVK